MGMENNQGHFDTQLEIASDQEVREPALYKVILLNDDYTTMEFVVHVLEEIFRRTAVEATQIMLHVHTNGAGVAGVYTKDIAETKVAEVSEYSRHNQFPLKCTMEKE